MKGKGLIDIEHIKDITQEIKDFGVNVVIKRFDQRNPNEYIIKIGYYVGDDFDLPRILPLRGLDYSELYEPLCELLDRLRDASILLNDVSIELYLEEWKDIPELYGEEVDVYDPKDSGFVRERKLYVKEFPENLTKYYTKETVMRYKLMEIIFHLNNSFDINPVFDDILKSDRIEAPSIVGRIKKFLDFK